MLLEIFLLHIKSKKLTNRHRYLIHEFKKLGLSIVRGSFEISCSYLASMALDDPYLHVVYKK